MVNIRWVWCPYFPPSLPLLHQTFFSPLPAPPTSNKNQVTLIRGDTVFFFSFHPDKYDPELIGLVLVDLKSLDLELVNLELVDLKLINLQLVDSKLAVLELVDLEQAELILVDLLWHNIELGKV